MNTAKEKMLVLAKQEDMSAEEKVKILKQSMDAKDWAELNNKADYLMRSGKDLQLKKDVEDAKKDSSMC